MIAFLGGVLSFISPCILPIIPSYLTYITGISFKELTETHSRSRLKWLTVFHSLLFIFGFSVVFILMGASASYLGQLVVQYQAWLMKAGGVLIILLGLHFIGIFNLPFLQVEKRVELKKKPLGYFGSFLVGVIFAAGWTPCVGPILSTILIYASAQQSLSRGVFLLAIYSLGLGIPFLLTSIAFNSFLSAFERLRRYMKAIILISGLFLITIGVLLITDLFGRLNAFFSILANP